MPDELATGGLNEAAMRTVGIIIDQEKLDDYQIDTVILYEICADYDIHGFVRPEMS